MNQPPTLPPDAVPPGQPPLPARFGQELGIVSHHYAALIGRLLRPHDLTWPQFALLVRLARHGGAQRVSDLAAEVDLTQPAVTKVVQKFLAAGLVEHCPDPDDQRNRPVRITPLGRAKTGAVQRTFAPAFAQLLQGWEPAALERLTADLARLAAGLKGLRDAGEPDPPGP